MALNADLLSHQVSPPTPHALLPHVARRLSYLWNRLHPLGSQRKGVYRLQYTSHSHASPRSWLAPKVLLYTNRVYQTIPLPHRQSSPPPRRYGTIQNVYSKHVTCGSAPASLNCVIVIYCSSKSTSNLLCPLVQHTRLRQTPKLNLEHQLLCARRAALCF